MSSRVNLCSEVRPQNFDQMVGQEEIVENIRSQAKRGKFFPCYILEGQFGSGKTTMARILAHAINCEHRDENGNPCGTCAACKAVGHGSSDILELDAASNTGVDAIRQLKESVSYMPTELKKKVYIIDEVHKLSDSAFNALLKVLEEPPEHVVFILCTTEMKKIPATIRSRAACYHYKRIPVDKIAEHLKTVAQAKKFSFDEEGLLLIAKNAAGSMRNALKLLEQSAEEENGATKEVVSKMLGLTDPSELFHLLQVLLNGETPEAIKIAKQQMKEGRDCISMVRDLLAICADCVSASVTGADALDDTESYREKVSKIISSHTTQEICGLTKGLMDLNEEIRKCPDDTTLVCGIIKMQASSDMRVADLSRRVAELERKVIQLSQGVAAETVPMQATVESPTVEQTQEEPVKEPATQETAPVDLFADGFVAASETPFGNSEPEISNEEETEAVSEPKMSAPETESSTDAPAEEEKTSLDAFELFDLFGASEQVETETTPVNHVLQAAVQPKEPKKTAEETADTEISSGVGEDLISAFPMENAEPDLPPINWPEEESLVMPEFDFTSEEPAFDFGPAAEPDVEDSETESVSSSNKQEETVDEADEDDCFPCTGPIQNLVGPASADVGSDRSRVQGNQEESVEILFATCSGSVDEFLQELTESDPVAENLFGLCLKREDVDGKVTFVTSEEAIFRMAKAYQSLQENGFPFDVKKVSV